LIPESEGVVYNGDPETCKRCNEPLADEPRLAAASPPVNETRHSKPVQGFHLERKGSLDTGSEGDPPYRTQAGAGWQCMEELTGSIDAMQS